jgi:hypothetical protein
MCDIADIALASICLMTRDLRLKFCLLCVNRQYTHDKGYVCQLTKEQADFIDDCRQFKQDDTEFKRLSIEKIDSYGLGDKKGFWKDFFKEKNVDYKLTNKVSFVQTKRTTGLRSRDTHTKI